MAYLSKDRFCNKSVLWLFCILGALLISSCSFIDVNVEPIAATVTELSTCNGVDLDGKPSGISEVFKPNEDKIFVCGYVKTRNPVNLEIHWYYNDELAFVQTGEDMEGYFYSYVQPGKTGAFQEGMYRIYILIGGLVVKSTEFQIK